MQRFFIQLWMSVAQTGGTWPFCFDKVMETMKGSSGAACNEGARTVGRPSSSADGVGELTTRDCDCR